MKRVPTMSMNYKAMSLSKIIPEKLGNTLYFDVDKETKQIIISRNPGQHAALITYPAAAPIIQSMPLIQWIQKQLGNRNYSKMFITWDGDRFLVQTGEKK